MEVDYLPINYLIKEYNSKKMMFTYSVKSNVCEQGLLMRLETYVSKYGTECKCRNHATCTCPPEFTDSACHYDACPKVAGHPEFTVDEGGMVYKIICINVNRPSDSTLTFM